MFTIIKYTIIGITILLLIAYYISARISKYGIGNDNLFIATIPMMFFTYLIEIVTIFVN